MQYFVRGLILLFIIILASACDREPDGAANNTLGGNESNGNAVDTLARTDHLPKVSFLLSDIKKKKVLVVVTRNAPTTYYYDRDSIAGYEYDLATRFARALDVQVKFLVVKTLEQVLDTLKQGKAHIAAAGLTKITPREKQFLSSQSYYQVRQQVVCRQQGKIANNVKDFSKVSLAVVSNSSYSRRLKTLQKRLPVKLSWKEIEDLDTEDLLEQVWKKEVDCTVADSNIVAINRRYYPELVVSFHLTKPQPLVWYMPKEAAELRNQVNSWFRKKDTQKRIRQLNEKYYGYVQFFNYVNTRTYLDRIDDTLPRFEKHFRRAAKQYSHDWALLAAQAYQESYWRTDAKSPTGVRGIMMLTRNTAKAMGVKNRRDAIQSINGGAKYLRQLKDRLPTSIKEPDRTWIALAAYNIGMGHVQDARRLARRFKMDPDKWNSLKKVLPLLRRKKYHQTLRYGYARGNEPVRYVTRVRDYFDLLLTQRKRRQ
jgi:membrane-bound lytic murein transglycosylase F